MNIQFQVFVGLSAVTGFLVLVFIVTTSFTWFKRSRKESRWYAEIILLIFILICLLPSPGQVTLTPLQLHSCHKLLCLHSNKSWRHFLMLLSLSLYLPVSFLFPYREPKHAAGEEETDVKQSSFWNFRLMFMFFSNLILIQDIQHFPLITNVKFK